MYYLIVQECTHCTGYPALGCLQQNFCQSSQTDLRLEAPLADVRKNNFGHGRILHCWDESTIVVKGFVTYFWINVSDMPLRPYYWVLRVLREKKWKTQNSPDFSHRLKFQRPTPQGQPVSNHPNVTLRQLQNTKQASQNRSYLVIFAKKSPTSEKRRFVNSSSPESKLEAAEPEDITSPRSL